MDTPSPDWDPVVHACTMHGPNSCNAIIMVSGAHGSAIYPNTTPEETWEERERETQQTTDLTPLGPTEYELDRTRNV